MKNKEIEELLNKFKNADSQQFNELVEDFDNVYKLVSYIEQLEKKVDQYENPDDLTLFYMWLDTKAKDKMKQLEKENKILRENAEHNDKVVDKVNWEINILKNNRDKAIEYVEKHTDKLKNIIVPKIDFDYKKLLDIVKGDSE